MLRVAEVCLGRGRNGCTGLRGKRTKIWIYCEVGTVRLSWGCGASGLTRG